MSNQFFEQQSPEMGLFTFYKEQQDEDVLLNQKQKGKRGKKKKGSRSKKKLNSLKRPSPNKQESSIPTLSNNDSCDEFLKSIRPKLKKRRLTEVTEQAVNEHLEEEKTVSKVVESPIQQPLKTQPKTYVYRQTQPRTEKASPSPEVKLSTSLVAAELTCKQVYQKERNSLNSSGVKKVGSREVVKQRIRTQIDQQLHRNHLDYIRSAECELIVGHPFHHLHPSRDSLPLPTPSRPSHHTLINKQAKAAAEGENGVQTAKMVRPLLEANKRYFNNLVEHMSVRPEYNQTVYRILRETLKFPELARSTHRHIKTETTSPIKQQLLQVRSHSYYKKLGPEAREEVRRGGQRKTGRQLRAGALGSK